MEILLDAILRGNYRSPNGELLKKIPRDRQYRLVVAIDDLDRCLPEQALEIFEAIKLFIDLPMTNFLLAMDQDMIQHALDLRYKQFSINRPQILAKQYTEKMIDLTFAIPSPSRVSFQNFTQKCLPNGSLLVAMYKILSLALPNNIRAWQRFSAKADLNRQIINEISTDGQLDETVLPFFYKLQCLSYKWPEIYQSLGSIEAYQKLEKCILEAGVTTLSSKYSSDEIAREIQRNSQNSDLVSEKTWNLLVEKSLIFFISSTPNIPSDIDIDTLNVWFSLDSTR